MTTLGHFMQQQTIFLEPDWDLDFGKPPQFELRFVQARTVGLYILGIAHSSIQIGDRFRRVDWYHPQRVPSTRDGMSLAGVRLRVVSLTSFHNVLNRVPAGMNVGIEFSGDATPLLNVLDEQGWLYSAGQYHQWVDQVVAMPKLILTR